MIPSFLSSISWPKKAAEKAERGESAVKKSPSPQFSLGSFRLRKTTPSAQTQAQTISKIQPSTSTRSAKKSDLLRGCSDREMEAVFRAKRANVFVKGAKASSLMSFRPRVVAKSEQQIKDIYLALSRNFVFTNIGNDEMKTIADAMEIIEVPEGTEVIRQGADGDHFYIISSGTFSVCVDGEPISELGNGKSFGEIALLYSNSPRCATVRAEEDSVLYRLDRETFRTVIARSSLERSAVIVNALSRIPVLRSLSSAQLRELGEFVELVLVAQGEYIIRKNDEGNIFYMIKEGFVRVCNINPPVPDGLVPDQVLGPGEFFGERALFTGESRSADVVAESDVVLMALDRPAFDSLLGPLKEDIYNRSLSIPSTDKSPLCMDRKELADSFRFSDSVKANQSSRQLLNRSDSRLSASSSDFEDGVSVLPDKHAILLSPSSRSIFTSSGAKLYQSNRSLSSAYSSRVLGAEQSIEQQQATPSAESTSLSPQTVFAATDDKIRFSDLRDLNKPLGEGTFAKVRLVSHKPSGKQYALKVMSKADLVAHKQQKNVIAEKRIMLDSEHPFIVKLHRAFQDNDNLYMLLDYCEGGELFSILHTKERSGMYCHQAKFYAAGVTSALAYLHVKDIAYRDLKPENILVDKEGYPKLTDFGFSKVVPAGSKTYTLCGTPEYIAPEVVLGRGHGREVDHWGLGILVFELLAGYTPFCRPNESEDNLAVCEKIVHGFWRFPHNFDPICKSLVIRLLDQDPRTRLGSLSGGVEDIKAHTWFSDIDFPEYEARRVEAPWIPGEHTTGSVLPLLSTSQTTGSSDESSPDSPGFLPVFAGIVRSKRKTSTA